MMNLSFSLPRSSRLLSLPERTKTSAPGRTGGSRGRAVGSTSQAWGAVLPSAQKVLHRNPVLVLSLRLQAQEDDMVSPIK